MSRRFPPPSMTKKPLCSLSRGDTGRGQTFKEGCSNWVTVRIEVPNQVYNNRGSKVIEDGELLLMIKEKIGRHVMSTQRHLTYNKKEYNVDQQIDK